MMRDETEERAPRAVDEVEGGVGWQEMSGRGPGTEVRPVLSTRKEGSEAIAQVDPVRSATYEVAKRLIPIEERVERARAHVVHAEILRRGGEVRHASGAMLAASITLLRAAVTPVVSMTEHRTKLRLLHRGLVAIGLGAWHDHIASLIDAALQAEIDMMVADRVPVSYLNIADVSPERVDAERGRECRVAACPASELEAYDGLASLTHDRTAILVAMTRSLSDEIELRRQGRSDLARGARITLEDLDLAACATLAETAVDADDKTRLLASSLEFHRTRFPLVAAVIKAALDAESARWGFTTSGLA